MADAFPLSGQVDPQAFPFLLMALNRQGATGSLKVAGPSYQKALYFRSGRILFASSNDPRDQLGAILIESGVLTPEQLEEANSKIGQGSPLAKVLADTGFVSQRELSEAARSKVERILSDVIAYETGSFEFEDGVLPKGAVDLKLATERLLLSAVRRVTDRAFVLRYLPGLDVVLKPTPEMSGQLTDVEAETGVLLAQIDGRKTLKEAAAATHLEEFEAAKMACALLFLGVLARDGQPSVATSPPDGAVPAFVMPDEGPEIDLSETARAAFGSDRAKKPPKRPAAPAEEEDQPFFTSPGAARSSPAPSRPEPPAPDDEPASSPEAVKLPLVPPPPRGERAALRPPTPPLATEPAPAVDSSPPPAPPPPRPGPSAGVAASAASAGASVAAGKAAEASDRAASLPSLPPNWRPSGSGQSASRTRPTSDAPPPVAPPSRDDLAALDALLKPKTVEGPLEPLERKAAADAQRWSPQFGAGSRPSEPERLTAGTIALRVVMIVLAAAVMVTGAWYLRERNRASAQVSESTPPLPTRPPRTQPPEPTTLSAAPSPLPTEVRPSALPTTAPPSPRAVVSAVPSPVPVHPSPVPPSPATAGDGVNLDQARQLLGRGNLDAAARDFASNLRRAPAGTLSIQLLVACSADTVQKAVASTSSTELFILPVNFKGRDCYRLCWGLYRTEARATSALGALPEYFRKNGATPKVAPAGQLLP